MATEVFDKGWVSNRPPTMLFPGELARAQETVYRSGSPGLWRAPGRTRFNVAAEAGPILGLRYCEFDGANGGPAAPILIGQVGSTLRFAAFSAETGSFSDLATNAGSGTHLDAIHYRNHFYLLNGNK